MKTSTLKSTIIFTLLLTFFISACKNEKKEDNKATNNTPSEKKTKENKKINDENNLKLFFDGTIQNDDEIQLAFKDIEGENHLSKKIKGSDSRWQRISFSFPEESIPYSFRLSLNNNESNKIMFDKIVLNRKNDRIIIRDSALLVYFELKNLKHEFEGKKLILEKISANQKAELVSKDNLNSRIVNRYSKINP